jgi:DNA polymerase III delta prime subunit
MVKLALQFMKRVNFILNTENVKYESAVIAEVIQKHFPDWRRVLNELQRYAVSGKIDSGILANMQDNSIRELIHFMKDRDFTEVRKWVKNNLDTDVNVLYNQFYDSASDYFTPDSIPMLVLHIATYQYQNAFSANPEINFSAFCAHVMLDLEFV